MIYIISGASRSGKTNLANLLKNKTDISFISVDALMMGFAGGFLDSEIHHENWPDVNAERMWPFLKNMIIALIESNQDYIFEGEQFLPHLIKEIMSFYPDQIRCVFLGFTDIEVEQKVNNVKKFAIKGDWLTTHMESYIEEHISNMIFYSKKVKKLCEDEGITYIDTSYNFEDQLQVALEYLTK